jgi:hypothetical protein
MCYWYCYDCGWWSFVGKGNIFWVSYVWELNILKYEFNSNLLCKFQGLTLWDKILKNLKKLNKIWFVFEKSKEE